MSNQKMLIEQFTVSYSFDTFRSGEKKSHFVSMGVKLDPAIDVEEFPVIQLRAAYRVSVATVHDALMRGCVTLEEANERIAELKNNFDLMRARLELKSAPPALSAPEM